MTHCCAAVNNRVNCLVSIWVAVAPLALALLIRTVVATAEVTRCSHIAVVAPIAEPRPATRTFLVRDSLVTFHRGFVRLLKEKLLNLLKT